MKHFFSKERSTDLPATQQATEKNPQGRSLLGHRPRYRNLALAGSRQETGVGSSTTGPVDRIFNRQDPACA